MEKDNFLENSQEELKEVKERKKEGGFLIIVSGIFILLIESIIDYYQADFYSQIEVFGIQQSVEQITNMAIAGIVMAFILGIFTVLNLNNNYFYPVVLILSVIVFIVSYAFWGPIILIIGSIVGMVKGKN